MYAVIDSVLGECVSLFETKKEAQEYVNSLKWLDKFINYETRYYIEEEDEV